MKHENQLTVVSQMTLSLSYDYSESFVLVKIVITCRYHLDIRWRALFRRLSRRLFCTVLHGLDLNVNTYNVGV